MSRFIITPKVGVEGFIVFDRDQGVAEDVRHFSTKIPETHGHKTYMVHGGHDISARYFYYAN